MLIKNIVDEFELFADLSLQESWDNCGVQVGNVNQTCTGVVLCLDITEKSVVKAIENGFNLIISHHPLLFNGLKSITCKNETERIVYQAIKHDIVIYSAHTNFDKVIGGVSFELAKQIGLKNVRILSTTDKTIKKIVCFVPKSAIETIEQAAFNAGAGTIGNYDSCSFSSSGVGSFKALEGANPYVGSINKIHREDEIKFETIVPSHRLNSVLNAIRSVHPYEEPAFEVFNIDMVRKDVGLGVIGEVDSISFNDFSSHLKKCLDLPMIRHSNNSKSTIKRVAICGGSGASFIKDAIYSKADVFLSGDFKYHDFQTTNNLLTIMDIGHFESEKFIINIFYDILKKKFSIFARSVVIECENPVEYI